MKDQIALILFALVTATLLFVTGIPSPRASAIGIKQIPYRGVTECEGMQVEVTFIYDPQSSKLKDFKSIDRCIVGSATVEWTPIQSIDVGKDGTFYAEHPSGNFVKGKITLGGEASGELGPNYVLGYPICDDGKTLRTYPKCTRWKASPVK